MEEKMEEKKETLEQVIQTQETQIKKKKKATAPRTVETDIPDIATMAAAPAEKKEPKKAPQKKSKSKKEKEAAEFQSEVKILLSGLNEIARVLPNGDILALHDQEIDFISPPIANILKRQGLDEKASKYSDYTVLLIGLTFIMVPRVQLIRERQGEKNARKISAGKIPAGNQGRQTKTNIRAVPDVNATSSSINSPAIYDPLG